MKIVWAPEALGDLRRVVQHVARDNPDAAARMGKRIVQSVRLQLGEHPMSGRRGRIEGTREFVISGTPYIVPYRLVDGDLLQIIRVFHAAQKWPDDLPF